MQVNILQYIEKADTYNITSATLLLNTTWSQVLFSSLPSPKPDRYVQSCSCHDIQAMRSHSFCRGNRMPAKFLHFIYNASWLSFQNLLIWTELLIVNVLKWCGGHKHNRHFLPLSQDVSYSSPSNINCDSTVQADIIRHIEP